jgi:acetolactate synthase I/III small subunit
MVRNYTLSILVKNTAGVLTRISGLFARRGYNISSLSVGETENPELSRITIGLEGDEYVLDQITKQLAKLIDVVKIKELKSSNTVFRELILVKISANLKQRAGIIEICTIFGTRIVDISKTTITVEMSGKPEKNAAFLNLIEEYGIIELVRTGLTGISRGEDTI